MAKSLCAPIREAHTYLTSALTLWEEENGRLSEVIERSVVEVSEVRKDIFEKKVKVQELNTKMHSLEGQITTNEKELGEAKSSVNRANRQLQDSESKLDDKEKEQAIVTGVGIGLLVIPIVGWVAGATMITVGLTVLQDNVNKAKENVNSAEGNVRDCENRLRDKKTEKDKLGEQLKREVAAQRETKVRLEGLEAKVQELQAQQKRLLEVNKKLKSTCHVMTIIWGKSAVLNSETRYAYSLEPLITPLKEIAEMFTLEEQREMRQTTYLLSKDMDFAQMSMKMKAICEKMPGNSLAILDDFV